MTGRVHSIQSLGTVDGPGIRFVVFMSGCNLRCKCCHNPDTWSAHSGAEYTAEEIVEKACRYKSYYGSRGGITVSGGEPLLQADFVSKIFELAHEKGINTCLDTSGSVLNGSVLSLLDVTDRALLDIKYTTDEEYRANVGCSIYPVLEFLKILDKKGIPTTVRQVIIPSVNDGEENISKLKEIVAKHKCVDKVELLPFRKICKVKYDNLGIEFPFGRKDEPSPESMKKLNDLL